MNPAILVAAEKVDHAPGIKNGKDFLLNLRVLLQKTGAQVLTEEPVAYDFGGSQFFRDDYAIEAAPGIRVIQSFFARIINGYAVVFAFIGEDQKSVDEMAKAMETFAPIRKSVTTILEPPPKPTPKPK